MASDRQEWLARRQAGIGASDAAAILGVGYANTNALSVWFDKTAASVSPFGDDGEESSDSEEDRLQIGLLWEPALRAIFEWKLGLGPVRYEPFKVFHDLQDSFLGCTPDGWLEDQQDAEPGVKIPVELKNLDAFASAEWNNEENDFVPLKYQVQVQHQMMVMGAPYAYIMALIGGNKPVIRRVERNEEFIQALREKLRVFWGLVVTRQMPPVDGSEISTQVLKKLYPQDSGLAVMMPPIFDEIGDKLAALKLSAKEINKRIDEYENLIRASIGTATFGVTPQGRAFSWVTGDRKGYTVKPGKTRTLRSIKKLPPGIEFQASPTVLISEPLAQGEEHVEPAQSDDQPATATESDFNQVEPGTP